MVKNQIPGELRLPFLQVVSAKGEEEPEKPEAAPKTVAQNRKTIFSGLKARVETLIGANQTMSGFNFGEKKGSYVGVIKHGKDLLISLEIALDPSKKRTFQYKLISKIGEVEFSDFVIERAKIGETPVISDLKKRIIQYDKPEDDQEWKIMNIFLNALERGVSTPDRKETIGNQLITDIQRYDRVASRRRTVADEVSGAAGNLTP